VIATTDILQALAGKLIALWPNRKVFTEEVSQGIDGNFFIHVIDSSRERKLGRRRMLSRDFDIIYFRGNKDPMEYPEWADKMLAEFEKVTVGDQVLHLTNVHCNEQDREYHMQCRINYSAALEQELSDPMEGLTHEEGLKIE